jgi:hypothetical protein
MFGMYFLFLPFLIDFIILAVSEYHKQSACKDVEWIQVAQGKMNEVMNFWVPVKRESFMKSSRKTQY